MNKEKIEQVVNGAITSASDDICKNFVDAYELFKNENEAKGAEGYLAAILVANGISAKILKETLCELLGE